VIGLGGTGLGDVDQGTQVDLLDLRTLSVGGDEREGVLLVFHLVTNQEVVGLDDGRHALDDLLAGHRHVRRHRARDDRLRDLVHRHVADEDDSTGEDERLGQLVVSEAFSIPGDDALIVAVKGSLEQVGSHRILQDAVAVVEDHQSVLVLEEGAVEALGRREALDHDVGLGGKTLIKASTDFGIVKVDLASLLESGEDGVRLAETTLASDDGRRDGASSNHVDEVFQNLEAFVDAEDQLRVNRLGGGHRLRRADFLNCGHTELLGLVADLIDDLVDNVVLAGGLQEDLATVGSFPLARLLVVGQKSGLGHFVSVDVFDDRCIIHRSGILYTSGALLLRFWV